MIHEILHYLNSHLNPFNSILTKNVISVVPAAQIVMMCPGAGLRIVLFFHLFSTLTLISGRPYHHIVNVWQSVPCTVWQQVSPDWPSIRLSRNGLAVGTHAQPPWAPTRPGCSMDQPVRCLLQKVRHCRKSGKCIY